MTFLGIEESKAKVVKKYLLLTMLVLIMWIIPELLGFGKGGFDLFAAITPNSNLGNFTIYGIMGALAALVLFGLIMVEQFIRKGDMIYGQGEGFYSEGETPHIKSFAKVTWFQTVLLILIIGGIAGLVVGVTKNPLFGVGHIQEQFTAFDNLIFNVFLAAPSENLGLAAVIAACIFGVRYYARRKNISKTNFILFSWLLSLIVGSLYGVILHATRYGFSDYGLFTIFVLWALGSFLTLATGSILPFLVLHMENNFFYGAGAAFSNDVTSIITIGTIVISIILYVYLYFIRKRNLNT